MYKYILLLLLLSSTVFGQTTGKQLEFNSAWGVDYESNMVKNPSAAKNLSDTLKLGATLSRDTSAGNKIDGKASFLLDASALNDYLELSLLSPSDEQTSGNCGFKGVFKGDATLYRAQILDGSSNVLAQTVPLTNETGFREFRVWYPCGASGARKVRITQTEAGTAPAINVGKFYYGRMEPGAGTSPNTFTAKVSATGVVSDETPHDWINGNFVVSSTFVFTGSPVSGLFTNNPNCTMSAASFSGTALYNRIAVQTSTSIIVESAYNGPTASPFTISCTKTGSDYVQPAITPDNFSFDWRDYTPTITASSGSLTNFTLSGTQYRRDASGKMWVKGVLTFNGSPGTWSIPRISIPEVVSTSQFNMSGVVLNDVGSNSYDAAARVASGASYIEIVSLAGTNGAGIALSQASPFAFGSTDAITWTVGPIDIVGWNNVQSTPLLVGSVTSNSNNALRIEQADITTICSVNGSCALGASYGSSVTITRTAQGRYTFAYPAFSSRPVCVVSPVGGLPYSIFVASDIPTTTSVAIGTRNSSLSDTDLTFSISCMGPR